MAPVSTKKKSAKSPTKTAKTPLKKKAAKVIEKTAKAVKAAPKAARTKVAQVAKKASKAAPKLLKSKTSKKEHTSGWREFTQKLFSLGGMKNLWALVFVTTSLGMVFVLDQIRQEVPSRGQVVTEAPKVEKKPEPVQVAAAPTAPVVTDKSTLAPQFAQVRTQDLQSRIAFWSEFLMNARDARAALVTIDGAPAIEDSAPLIPSKYDCTTFVETVAALSRSESSRDFYSNLLSIRYRNSQPTFATRNHFPEADWIPNNESAGILRDVTIATAERSGVDREYARKSINKTQWLAKQSYNKGRPSRSLASVAQDDVSQAAVAYIPLKSVEGIQRSIPTGTILNIVRHDQANKPVLITHQGFVIQKDGKTWFRHASVGGSIKTVPLSDYLRDLERKAREKSWPLAGVNLNQLN